MHGLLNGRLSPIWLLRVFAAGGQVKIKAETGTRYKKLENKYWEAGCFGEDKMSKMGSVRSLSAPGI